MSDGTVRPEDMQRARGTIAPWLASITFGGPDLRTVYLGSLLGNRFPVSVHRWRAWPWSIGELSNPDNERKFT